MASKPVKVIDFRSDTFSLPTEGMRKAIYNAEVGDDMYMEDPTVRALETRCCQLFEKQAACYMPTGTMILAHCDERSSEIIVGHLSHISMFEQRGVSQFGGISIREVTNKEDGTFDIAEMATRIRPQSIHEPITKLICIENTHNMLGGRTIPLEWIDELTDYVKSKQIALHMDGARIFNAALKLNVPVSRITRDFDSLTFCFSKGLGGPYGAMVLGSQNFITKVRRIRKAMGGSMRQIGFMAAAGLYALDHMEHLQSDHQHTQLVADAFREINHPFVRVPKAEDIHSNILILNLDTDKITSDELANKFKTVSDDEEIPTIVNTLPFGPDKLRIVLCCNNTRSDVEEAAIKIKTVLRDLK